MTPSTRWPSVTDCDPRCRLLDLDRPRRPIGTRVAGGPFQSRIPLHTTHPVLAQVWHDGARQARLASFLNAVTIHPLDDGRVLRQLLALTRTSDVVDAHLVLVAVVPTATRSSPAARTTSPASPTLWARPNRRSSRGRSAPPRRMGTTQPAIARIEGGGSRRSLNTLKRLAAAVGKEFVRRCGNRSEQNRSMKSWTACGVRHGLRCGRHGSNVRRC